MFKLIAVIYWILTVLLGIPLFVISSLIFLLTAWWDRRRRLLHLWASFWAQVYVWLNPFWYISVIDRHKIRSSETKVIISNHQSATDIFFLYLLYTHFKWVSKIEMFKTPIIGWNMYLNAYIPIKRGSLKANNAMMKECLDNLARGNSVFIFPEGTRSKDGKLLPFKNGAFEIALRAKVPIQPIYINGSTRALAKKSVVMRHICRITVQVLDPIEYESFADLNAAELKQRIYSRFEELQKARETTA